MSTTDYFDGLIVTRGMEPSLVGCRISAETTNMSTLAGHTTITGVHRCLIRANNY